MDTVTKNRSLVWIIIFLLLSNIAILIFFLFLSSDRDNRGRDSRNGISDFLQKEIGFDKQQMDQYQKLKDKHMQIVKPLFNGIRAAKDSFYNYLYTADVPDSTLNKSAAFIGEKQMSLDMQFFRHLKMVRGLCTPAQLPKFDSLFKKVVERMTGGRFRKRDNNKSKD